MSAGFLSSLVLLKESYKNDRCHFVSEIDLGAPKLHSCLCLYVWRQHYSINICMYRIMLICTFITRSVHLKIDGRLTLLSLTAVDPKSRGVMQICKI